MLVRPRIEPGPTSYRYKVWYASNWVIKIISFHFYKKAKSLWPMHVADNLDHKWAFQRSTSNSSFVLISLCRKLSIIWPSHKMTNSQPLGLLIGRERGWPTPSWLIGSVGRAIHRYRGVKGLCPLQVRFIHWLFIYFYLFIYLFFYLFIQSYDKAFFLLQSVSWVHWTEILFPVTTQSSSHSSDSLFILFLSTTGPLSSSKGKRKW